MLKGLLITAFSFSVSHASDTLKSNNDIKPYTPFQKTTTNNEEFMKDNEGVVWHIQKPNALSPNRKPMPEAPENKKSLMDTIKELFKK